MAETLALADHENLMSSPANGYRRATGDTAAIPENEYQRAIVVLGQSAAQATTARSNRLAILRARPDGK